MAGDPWLTEFRRLHERSRKSTLSNEEQELYLSAREQLAQSLTRIQGLMQRAGETARQTFRVALAMPLELSLSDGPLRAVTLDVGRGGFSAMVQKLPEQREGVGFQLKLPGGLDPIAGRARVVDSRKHVGNFRASFAFVDLGVPEGDRIERALFDHVLARLGD